MTSSGAGAVVVADKPPKHSAAIKALLNVPRFASAASLVAYVQKSLAEEDWREECPDGLDTTAVVEIRGVCVKKVTPNKCGTAVLELVSALNCPIPDNLWITDYPDQVLLIDGATSTGEDVRKLPNDTRLYAKRLIVNRGCNAEYPPQAYWRLQMGSFITRSQLARIEDWSNLP
ncbi:hypothetical protein JCM5350_007354 [Sporobolomyces pararoseus]